LGYSRARLRELLSAELEWHDSEWVPKARQLLRKRIEQGTRGWRKRARSHKCSVDTFVRNLLACSGKANIGVYRILLDMPAVESLLSPSMPVDEIRTILGNVPAPLELVHVLAVTEDHPTPEQFDQFFAFDPILALAFSIIEESARVGVSDARVRSLVAVAGRRLRRVRKPTANRYSGARLSTVLAWLWQHLPLPILEHVDIKRLPPFVVDGLAAPSAAPPDTYCRSRLIQRRAEASRDLQWPAVVQAIRTRQFAGAAVIHALRSPPANADWRAVRTAIQEAPSSQAGSTFPSRTAQLSKDIPTPLRLALSVLVRKPDERWKVLSRMRAADRTTVLQQLSDHDLAMMIPATAPTDPRVLTWTAGIPNRLLRVLHRCRSLNGLDARTSQLAGSLILREIPARQGITLLNRLPVPPNTRTILTAVRRHPAVLLPFALKRLSVREMVQAAFTSPHVGVELDRRLSKTQRLELLPWIRKTWARAPLEATVYEVAAALSLADTQYLRELAIVAAERKRERAKPGTAFDQLYHTYDLPKRSGGTRTITVPEPRLRLLQRRLLDVGFAKLRAHPAAHGFIRRRSTLTNAQIHVGQRMVVNVDIESCFPSTEYLHIARACRQLAGGRLSERAVRFLTDVCSYSGGLPIGAPTSPQILNLVLRPADAAIAKVARRYGICYTRYADDLTFSGSADVQRILPFVERVLGDWGFTLEPRKTNIFRRGRRQVVTGLVVNEKPNLPRRIRRRLRAAAHQRANGDTPHWHGRPMDDSELVGRLAHLNLVQPDEAREYVRMIDNAPLREEE
jgi:retron-type reverse transcriptase